LGHGESLLRLGVVYGLRCLCGRRLVVTGKLVEAAPKEVLSGRYRRRRILVAHWAILDARVVGLRRQVGRTYRLTVEPFADHPQLATERVMTTPDQLDPEMYYDVERTSGGSGAKVAGQP